jgi:hypothetical protein
VTHKDKFSILDWGKNLQLRSQLLLSSLLSLNTEPCELLLPFIGNLGLLLPLLLEFLVKLNKEGNETSQTQW